MSTPPSILSLIKNLFTHSSLFHKANKDVLEQLLLKHAAYNALQADRLKMLSPESGTKSDRPVLSIERHLERVKKAEEGLAKAEWDRKDVLRNLWNATVLLKDALAGDEGGREEELEKPVVEEKPTSGDDGEALEVASARSLES